MHPQLESYVGFEFVELAKPHESAGKVVVAPPGEARGDCAPDRWWHLRSTRQAPSPLQMAPQLQRAAPITERTPRPSLVQASVAMSPIGFLR
jgi:hypothetical protein